MSSGTRLFVRNLPENIEENDLRHAFSTFGEVTNLDIKTNSTTPDSQTKFAFVTLTASNYEIESCIKHFSNENFRGGKLYVTRARESFLERLQREREQAQKIDIEKSDSSRPGLSPKTNPVIKSGDNYRKRKLIDDLPIKTTQNECNVKVNNLMERQTFTQPNSQFDDKQNTEAMSQEQKKKFDSEKKRMESMKKKRLEFKEKKMIIKTGLTGLDKVQNKKILFSEHDNEEDAVNGNVSNQTPVQIENKSLFDGEDSGDEVSFEIKKHFEGKKGQKVLDLQSRYKSDKRFTLDERFIEDNETEKEANLNEENDADEIELNQTDEKSRQLNILQEILGVAIKSKYLEHDSIKTKNKTGMLRFDPSQPQHAKFVVPMAQNNSEHTKKK